MLDVVKAHLSVSVKKTKLSFGSGTTRTVAVAPARGGARPSGDVYAGAGVPATASSSVHRGGGGGGCGGSSCRGDEEGSPLSTRSTHLKIATSSIKTSKRSSNSDCLVRGAEGPSSAQVTGQDPAVPSWMLQVRQLFALPVDLLMPPASQQKQETIGFEGTGLEC